MTYRIPILWVALAAILGGAIGASYSWAIFAHRRQTGSDQIQLESAVQHQPKETFWERATGDPVSVFTLALVVFTLVLAVSTVGLWLTTRRLQVDGVRQISVAEQALSVARLTLTGVERPILELEVFGGSQARELQPPGLVVDEGRTYFSVVTENVGKQIAIINYVVADYFVQRDTTLPELEIKAAPMSASSCTFNFLGELPVKPGAKIVLWGDRHETVSAHEIDQIDARQMFGFFRIQVVYADPVGVLRSSVTTFWFSPSWRGFIRMQSADRILEKATIAEQKEAQRKALSEIIRINSEA